MASILSWSERIGWSFIKHSPVSDLARRLTLRLRARGAISAVFALPPAGVYRSLAKGTFHCRWEDQRMAPLVIFAPVFLYRGITRGDHYFFIIDTAISLVVP